MDTLDVAMPEDKLPACWNDDKRMNALFAPCKHVSIAPEAWKQKMSFWSEQLRAWCRHRRSPLVSVTSARNAFARRANRPACLHVVLQEYVDNGEYVPASLYTKALNGNGDGWVRWGARVAFKPAALAVGVLTSYLPFNKVPHDGMATASIDPEEPYVNQVVIKELTADLLRSWPEDRERIGTIEELEESATQAGIEPGTFRLALGYMMTAGLAVRHGEIYKMADSAAGKVSPISSTDGALHELVAAERRLEADLARLRAEEAGALREARAAVRAGSKAMARTHLTRKQRVANRATSCEAALDNVRRLVLEMRQAELNNTIVHTYRQSVGAMKRVMKEENLNEDTAHDAMDEVREVLEACGEVERSLAGPLDEADLELEEELRELLGSGGGAGGGETARPEPKRSKLPEKEYMFDGEARMMAELNDLSLPDPVTDSPNDKRTDRKEKIAVSVGGWDNAPKSDARKDPSKTDKPSQHWYPPANKSLTESWSQLKTLQNTSLDALSNSMTELQSDDRLHPGQKIAPTTPRSIVYNTDFQIQDHRLDDGVWYLSSDGDNGRHRTVSADFGASTSYTDREAAGGFEAAPGSQREGKQNDLDEIERRLQNLRSFN